MKKIIILLVLFSVFSNLDAQYRKNSNLTWFSLSLKGGYGSSFMFNKPTVDDQNITHTYFNPSYFYGAKLGLIFGDYVGVSGEVTMNSFSQKYDIQTNLLTFNQHFKANTFDIGVMLNFQSETGFYFDIGPKFSTLKNASLITSLSGVRTENDRLNKFKPKFTNVVFGLGIKPVMNDFFEMKIGIRGVYSLSSIVNDPGYIIPADNKILYFPLYLDENTHAIQLMATLEFTYIFGKFGKASCGKYRFMLNQ